jgi:hypothetical protein
MNCYNIVGLIFDIAGVILLYFFGLPSKYNSGDVIIMEGEISKEDKCKNKLIKIFSAIGIFLILIGFVIQLIGNLRESS